MLNTLAIVKKMTAAGMPVQQAEAVAETLVSSLEDEVASKRDVTELKRDMVQIEANLKRDIKELEVNLKRDVKELELKMDKWQADNQRQTLQIGLAMAALVITVLGFLFRFMGR